MRRLPALLLAALAFLSWRAIADDAIVRLATTTSTDNSGLLRDLLPRFEKATGYKVHVIAVGTGKALRMGEAGDVDVVLVHARAAEERFVASGAGEQRHAVMYNDFVLVGPNDDPARVRQAGAIGEALRRIASVRAPFVSRGDDSGTHKKELALWRAAGIAPTGDWYREVGQGMGKALQIAGELDAYILTDRGTWLAYHGKLPLALVFEGDAGLRNPYGIIPVNPRRFPDSNHAGAMALVDWLTSPTGQQAIDRFRVDGLRLFTPNAKTATSQDAAAD